MTNRSLSTLGWVLFGLCIFLTASSVYAAEPDKGLSENQADKVEYGRIYLEDPNPFRTSPFEIGIFYGMDYQNPYLSTQRLTLRITRAFEGSIAAQFFRFGFSFTREFSEISSALQFQLANGQSGTTIHVPTTQPALASLLLLEAIPVRGHLNLASDFPLDLSLKLRIGAGTSLNTHLDASATTEWAGALGVTVHPRFEIETSIGQQIETVFDSTLRNSRWIGQTGLLFRF